MALTEAWTALNYHPEQSAAWRSKQQFIAILAGRGSGKTELARRRSVRYLPVKKPWPDPMYFYALPTYNQAKRVAWKPLKALVPKDWIKSISESDMVIETVFGSSLHLVGMDKPKRIEGNQWDGGVLDESCDQRPGAFGQSVLPALSHRNGWCWRIGVAKRFGVGAKEFRDFWKLGQRGTDPNVASFWWKSADIIPPDALEFARRNLDEVDFREQYEASWETAGGRVFHAFEADHNVTGAATYHDYLDIYVGSDFNVDPMAWTLSHKIGDELYVFDELFIRDTNTQATLNELHSRYGNGHLGGWVFMGDASGRARKTSATQSDYQIIHADNRFKKKRVLYPKANPAVLDRFAACNALLCNANDERRLFINPRCKHLIEDLNERSYKPGTREPNDHDDVSHCSDALGYVVHPLFPLQYGESQTTGEVHVG